MSKNVWYISKYFAPETATSPGGRGWMLLKGVSKLGMNVTVVTSNSNNLIDPVHIPKWKKIDMVDGIKLVWLDTYKYSVAKSIKRIVSWFHFEYKLFFLSKSELAKPDVIVVSSLSLLTILNGLFLKRKYKCRLVFEIRDIWPLTITEEGGISSSNLMVKFLSWVERIGYKYSDAIIGTMPNLESHVREVSSCSTPVYCVPMGVSDQQLESVSGLDQTYIKTYLSSSKLKVVHAGTIGITNALETFFEAAIKLKDNSNIEFIVVGDGALKEKYISEYSYLKNVVFAPKVDKNQVQSVLSHCDVVYFSTFKSKVWDYGQSLNKVIDYMLSGKPIIASFSGFRSMINEADSGYFVPAEDPDSLATKLLEISRMDPQELYEMGRRGREWLLLNQNYDVLSEKFKSILIEDK